MILKQIFLLVLFISNFNFSFSLTDVQVNGGNFGSVFSFIISGTADSSISASLSILVKIIVEEEEKEAECSIENTNVGELAIYSCIYNDIINGDIYLKKEQENISGINNNLQIKPYEKNIKYIEAFNLEFDNENWIYDLKGEIAGDIILNSLLYMDIKVNNDNKIAGCIINSKDSNQILLKCKINSISQDLSNRIIIPQTHSTQSTLKFNPSLTADINFVIYKNIPFVRGEKLYFNTNNKWQFTVLVPYQYIPVATKSVIDILYNGELSSASCFTNNDSMLDCIVEKDGQDKLDLVKIHFIPSGISTITWNNLTHIYEIPIKAELEYKSSFDLVYLSTKVWSYKIKITELSLPENGLVTLNLKINDLSTISRCYHISKVLNCKTESIKEEDTTTLKITYTITDASITWKNIKTVDIPITLTSTVVYENSYDLTFKNNKWTFMLKATPITSKEIMKKFPISIKIKYGAEKNNGIAYCYTVENSINLYNCEVVYENQNINDLILINGIVEEDEVSVIWSNNFEEKQITLLASLHYIKAYELMYYNDKWIFKISVEDILADQSKLVVDIIYNKKFNDTATCIYHEKILSCTRDSLTQSPSESLILKMEKGKGSITWEEVEVNEVKMPLTINKNLIRAYGKYFSDNWNFYLDVQNIGVIPDDSYFIIDILHNDQEVTATCELSNRTQGASVSVIFCHYDGEEQSRKDEILLNTQKIKGSFKFANFITESNNTISEVVSEPTSFYLLGADEMEFIDNEWTFTLYGNSERDSYKGEIFIVEIKYILLQGEYDSTAKCWSKGGKKSEKLYFLCNVEYGSQTDKGLIQLKYFQSTSNLLWNGGIDDNYPITLKGVSLVLVKAYDMTLEKTWIFKLNIEGGSFPSGSRIVIDIIVGIAPKSIYCSSLNSSLIICDSQTSSKTDLIKISDKKISNSGVLWTLNRQPDYLIFTNVVFEYVNVYNLFFNVTINKWIFLLKKKGEIPKGSKFIVDIKYNNLASIAICYNNITNDELNCYVERETQSRMDLVQLYHIKTLESSITWTNLLIDEKISLICDLTLVKAENLRIGPDQFWIFEIYITDETIPNYSKFTIDIYYEINSIQSTTIAECYLDNKILSCNTKLNSYELVTIKLTKKEGTVTWKNKAEYEVDNVPMVITSSLKYTNITKITYVENKYCFYVDLNNYIPKKGEVIIDIEIGGTITTARCIAESITKLKCIIKSEDYQNDNFVYIIQKNTDASTVTWVNLEKKIQLNYINLEFKGAFNKKSLNSTHQEFKILTSINNLVSGTEIYVRINYVDSYGNIISTTTVPCQSENEFLTCIAPKNSQASDFNLCLTSSTSQMYNYENILWVNENNRQTSVYNSVSLNFDINSFSYNTENTCYEFTFEDTSYTSGETFFVTDITIGDQNTYAYCSYVSNYYFRCKTPTIEYKEEYEIKISKTQTYGDVVWKNLNVDKRISNYIYVEIIHIYNLHFENNKWRFKLKTDKTETSSKIYLLDVSISGLIGNANCTMTNGIFDCIVDSETQTTNSLIKINYNINGDIKLNNLQSTGIPLDISLEFNKIYDLSYSTYYNLWYFNLETKLYNEEMTIPQNSIFSVDILYDNKNDMALCKQINEINNHILYLQCQTQNEVPQNSLISLNNIKSEYSSITWKTEIPDNLDIFITTQFYVSTVDNLLFNDSKQKWSFDMKLNSNYYYNYNYPLNSKIKIDLIYEGYNSTATCTFISSSSYTFQCVPDVENQKNTDYFEIEKNKKKGTVEYGNSDYSNLIILSSAKLTFKKAYDLVYDGICKFKIEVESGYTLMDKRAITVEFRENNDYRNALCIMNRSILFCESLSYYYSSSAPVYLVSDKQDYVEWNNLYNDEPIYVLLHINLKNVFGIYMENKWKFNIKYEYSQEYKNYYNNHALLDIYVNNEESTALCKIFYDNVLKCESNHYNQNIDDIIEIVGDYEPNLGTIYFSEEKSQSERTVKPANITINLLKIDSKLYSYQQLYLYIYGYFTDYYYSYNSAATLTEIELLVNKTNHEQKKIRSSCEITYNYHTYDYDSDYYCSFESCVFLYCSADSQIIKNESTIINIDSDGYSKYVQFIVDDKNDLIINTSTYYDYDYDWYDDIPDIDEISKTDRIDTTIEDKKNNTGNNTKEISDNTGKIIGGVIGGCAGLAVVGGAIYVIYSIKAGANAVNAVQVVQAVNTNAPNIANPNSNSILNSIENINVNRNNLNNINNNQPLNVNEGHNIKNIAKKEVNKGISSRNEILENNNINKE